MFFLIHVNATFSLWLPDRVRVQVSRGFKPEMPLDSSVQSPRSLLAARDSWAEETIASGEEQVKTAVFAGYCEKRSRVVRQVIRLEDVNLVCKLLRELNLALVVHWKSVLHSPR